MIPIRPGLLLSEVNNFHPELSFLTDKHDRDVFKAPFLATQTKSAYHKYC